MSLEKIEKKIRESGKKETDGITKAADAQISNIKEDIDREAKTAYKKIRETRKQELILVPHRIISDARMLKKKELDEKKMEIIEKAFNKAAVEILNASDGEKKKILKRLADYGKKHIDDPVVFVDKKYAELIDASVRDVGDFGVIVESKDGSVRIDNTLTIIMDRIRMRLIPDVARVLFGDKS